MGVSGTAGVFLISSIVISCSSCIGGSELPSCCCIGVRGTASVFAIVESGTGLSNCIGGRKLLSELSGMLGRLSISFTLPLRSV